MRTWDLTEIETPGGTLSPVVLTSEDEARAVLIGLDPGQELGDHQVKEHAWVVVVDGLATFRSGAESIEAGAGTLLRFDPDERHSVATDAGATILLLLAPWPGAGLYRGEQRGAAAAG
jgi:quercetin dioxygenase-like cupin family protein